MSSFCSCDDNSTSQGEQLDSASNTESRPPDNWAFPRGAYTPPVAAPNLDKRIGLVATDNNSDTASANPPLSAPTNTDELDELFRKLEERIEYNRHDMGEMGMFVRVGYVKNFLKDSKPEFARLIALKQREELENTIVSQGSYGPDRSYSSDEKGIIVIGKTELDERIATLNTIIGSSGE